MRKEKINKSKCVTLTNDLQQSPNYHTNNSTIYAINCFLTRAPIYSTFAVEPSVFQDVGKRQCLDSSFKRELRVEIEIFLQCYND